jgi:nucleoside-diphosphate-sugar epimerase
VEGETFNLGTGVEISIGEVAERIVRLIGREVTIVTSAERLRPATSEVERLIADVSLMRARTGWNPKVDLDEGLARTIEWIRGAPELFKPNIYNV